MKRKILVVLAVIVLAVLAFANTQGPTGGTGAGAGWTGPTNIFSTDAIYATQSIPLSSTSTTLSSSTFGFSIPVGATINGIQVDIVRHCSGTLACAFGGSGTGRAVNLTKIAATFTGTTKTEATQWGTTDGTSTFGSAADLWGTTWAPSDVNSTGFGAIIQIDNDDAGLARTASIDSIRITVTFTPAPTSSGFLNMFGLLKKPLPINQTRGGHVPCRS